jgi:nucleotide-binding universal stress UspA family protein
LISIKVGKLSRLYSTKIASVLGAEASYEHGQGDRSMKDYQRILVGTDFSDPSMRAARRGAELARHYGATLILLHVVEHFPEDMPNDRIAPENLDPATFYCDRARQNLAKLAEKLTHKDVTQEVIMSSGSAKYEILRFAQSERIDLIVVGSHGEGMLQVFGSTAMGVMIDAPCDAMVIRVAE